MTDIPATARAFERWMAEVSGDWPQELKDAGHIAMLTLRTLDQPDAHKSRAFMEASRKDLMNFAVAFTEWRMGRGIYNPPE